MRSYTFLLIVLVSFFCISLNAQVFVGGSVNFSTNNSKRTGITPVRKNSDYNLSLRPSVGKFLSEKLAAGLTLDISLQEGTTENNNKTVIKSSEFGVSPFLRYYAFKLNKFSVYGQGNLGIGFSGSSQKTGATTDFSSKTTQLYLSVFPGLSYDINDKISLETSINILSFGYYYKVVKEDPSTEKSSNFNFGVGTSNIITVGAISIGAIIKL